MLHKLQILSLSLITALGMTGIAAAQNAKGDAKTDEARKPVAEGKADVKAKTPAHRASKIIGMKVTNESGKDLGSVNDLVIDLDQGEIRYAAVSYGAVLGLGGKLFAVPWHAFDVRKTVNADGYHLVLTGVTEAELKNAPGFDQNTWPDFADEDFKAQLDKFYRTNTKQVRRTTTTTTEVK